MVREPQIGAPALDGEGCWQLAAGDHRTLDVPPGPPLPQTGAVPMGFALALGSPQQRVQWVALAPALRVSPTFGEELLHSGPVVAAHAAQPPVGAGLGGGNVEVVVITLGVLGRHPVGDAQFGQAFHVADHLRDGLHGAQVVGGWDDVQGVHVVAEEFSLLLGEVAPVHTGGRRTLQQGIVDVGDVLHVVDLKAGGAPVAHQQVELHIGVGVAQVGGVVGGDPADVERGQAVGSGGGQRGCVGGVVEPQALCQLGQAGHFRGTPRSHADGPFAGVSQGLVQRGGSASMVPIGINSDQALIIPNPRQM